eukprot:9646173-Alexandrium_andersonii.AAC.1
MDYLSRRAERRRCQFYKLDATSFPVAGSPPFSMLRSLGYARLRWAQRVCLAACEYLDPATPSWWP